MCLSNQKHIQGIAWWVGLDRHGVGEGQFLGSSPIGRSLNLPDGAGVPHGCLKALEQPRRVASILPYLCPCMDQCLEYVYIPSANFTGRRDAFQGPSFIRVPLDFPLHCSVPPRNTRVPREDLVACISTALVTWNEETSVNQLLWLHLTIY